MYLTHNIGYGGNAKTHDAHWLQEGSRFQAGVEGSDDVKLNLLCYYIFYFWNKTDEFSPQFYQFYFQSFYLGL